MYLMEVNNQFLNFYTLMVQLKEAEGKLKEFSPEPKSKLWEELDEEIYGLKSCSKVFEILDKEGYLITYVPGFGAYLPIVTIYKKDVDILLSPKINIDLRWEYEKDYFYNIQKGDKGTPEDFVPFSDDEVKKIKELSIDYIKYTTDSTKLWNRKSRNEWTPNWF